MSDFNPDDLAALAADREAYALAEAETRGMSKEIRDGIEAIRQAQEAARADVATVDVLIAQAEALSAQIAARLALVEAFTPGATYRQADLAAIKGEVVGLLTRQGQLTEAQSRMFEWRRAVDQNAVLTDGALLGLAQLVVTDQGGSD